MKLLFSKVGSVTYFSSNRTRASKVGDMGETEGLLRYLVKAGHEVMFIGPYQGDPPDGVKAVSFDLTLLDQFSSGSEIIERCTPVVERCREFNATAWVQICGYAPTMSWPDNSKGTQVLTSCVRYGAPLLWSMQQLKLPRICVNNDPRTYPQDQEITTEGWRHCMPVAMLSQRTRTWSRRLGGARYQCREVYSKCENWAYREPVSDQRRLDRSIVIAHAHIKDGCKAPKRNNVFSRLLTGEEVVYGKGWEAFDRYDETRMLGQITPDEVDTQLARSKVGPIVAVVDGFYTSKLRTYLQQGCAPILFGRGEPHTYDPYERYFNFDDIHRVTDASELRAVTSWFLNDEDRRISYVNQLYDATNPDFTLLEDCLSDLIDPLRGPGTEGWWERYGGYRDE